MVQRCHTIENKQYKDYGGRGITVCKEWIDSPEQFINDMYPSFQEGLSIDRIDNDKGYSKENCRWATRSEQCINQRISKSNTSGFLGVSYNNLANKFKSTISINKVVTHLGYYNTAIEAAIARNNYIVENNLPHKLNTIPDQDEEQILKKKKEKN